MTRSPAGASGIAGSRWSALATAYTGGVDVLPNRQTARSPAFCFGARRTTFESSLRYLCIEEHDAIKIGIAGKFDIQTDARSCAVDLPPKADTADDAASVAGFASARVRYWDAGLLCGATTVPRHESAPGPLRRMAAPAFTLESEA